MKVISIDPGYDRCGVAVMRKEGGKEVFLYSTCIQTDKETTMSARVFEIGTELEALIKKHQPDAVALEKLFFNKNQTTAISVAEVRGVVLYLAKEYNLDVFEYGPQEVKVAVTGYGKSDKGQVMDMVKKLVTGVPEQAVDDEYDAIAIGITCLAHRSGGENIAPQGKF